MYDDLIINKINTINKCIERIRYEYNKSENSIKLDFTKQDSIILNLERASQATIDMASHIVRIKKLGIPQTNRDVFVILENNNLILSKISKRMQAMVGFRNIAVHDYQSLNLDIIIEIVENHLNDFTEFINQIIK
ncbi:MAG: type VII toxin-antitoxin system HepT family RNase toxin [bacterium]